MKKISTTALAKERDIEAIELFKLLSEKKWIYKADGQWQLTKEGRMAGGDINYNPKFGEYIVWPIDLNLDQKTDYGKTLNATKIGEIFNLSSQKINLYLSELGWIERDQGGWVLTDAGQKNGAIQMEAQNAKPYIVWNESIISNKHLIREIKGATGDVEYQKPEDVSNDTDDFRKKISCEFKNSRWPLCKKSSRNSHR